MHFIIRLNLVCHFYTFLDFVSLTLQYDYFQFELLLNYFNNHNLYSFLSPMIMLYTSKTENIF